jgi:hypothetical protein
MFGAIEKLIEEYEIKISNCEILLAGQQINFRAARKSNDDTMRGILSKEIAIKNAQKTSYMQAKSDIESLLDYV